MSAPAIQFFNVSKRYGQGPKVLDGVSFGVDEGSFFGLAGINGAGKTSLIKCLLDLADFQGGSISIFGVPSSRYEARRPLAYLPERFIPPHYLTGTDFLKMMAELRQQKHDERAAFSMCAQLDLDAGALTRPVRAFSKGMTQKLGLASVFLSDRPIMVLDEPMSGLDPKARALVKDQLFRLREAGKTLFFTSHHLADVDEICGEIAVLHDGKVAFTGSPRDLVQQTGEPNLERAFLQVIRSGAGRLAA